MKAPDNYALYKRVMPANLTTTELGLSAGTMANTCAAAVAGDTPASINPTLAGTARP